MKERRYPELVKHLDPQVTSGEPAVTPPWTETRRNRPRTPRPHPPQDPPSMKMIEIARFVEEVNQTKADLERRGLTAEHPPRDYEWGRSAYLREPSGSLIGITQAASEAPH